MCDGIRNTVTVVKDTMGNVFGGFTDVGFASRAGSYVGSDQAFLFSLERSGFPPSLEMFPVLPGNTNSIYCHTGYGPTFGGGHDLYIADLSNQSANSYVNVGTSYNNKGKGTFFLTKGSRNFQVTDVEVWELQLTSSSTPSDVPEAKVEHDKSLEAQLLATGSTPLGSIYRFDTWLQSFVSNCYELEARVEHDRLTLRREEENMRATVSETEVDVVDSEFCGLVNGILHFDAGGELICTMQHTLGCFSGSMLDVKYCSGRWRESNWELDESGYVFEEVNQFCFRKLINVMRMRSMQSDVLYHSPASIPRKHQQEMSRMLRYYQIAEREFLSYGCVFRLSKNAVRALRAFTVSTEARWELLYRGSRDGFDAATFHRLCDGTQNTVTIVEDTNGNLFGGVACVAWSSSNQSVPSPKAFLFSLRRGRVETLEAFYAAQNPQIHCHQNNGPTFTSSLTIINMCNTQAGNTAIVGGVFYANGRSRHYLTNDAQAFTVQDIEVWAIIVDS
jgi:hypothetical protein